MGNFNIIPALMGLSLIIVAVLIISALRRNAEGNAQEQGAASNAAEIVPPVPSIPETPKRKRGRPRKVPAPMEPAPPQQAESPAPAPVQQPAPRPAPAPRSFVGNNAFAGECVAFSGKLPDMTRAEAIQAVAANGGRAFEDMPACTTLLVLGEHPGTYKREKARERGVKIIDAQRFWTLMNQPLTLTPDEFAAAFAA